jgi:pimeloyl-ACP methyl ester carboxylesterase
LARGIALAVRRHVRLVVLAALGCHHLPAPAPDAQDLPKQLNLLFVHGVDSGAARATAQDSLVDLEAYVTEHVAAQSRRVNLYTDLDGNVLSPSIDAPSDGTGIPSALKWRAQLVAKLQQAYPDGEGDIVLIGHSTGGRAAMEVAANVGADGQPGNFDWGVADRIAGVITLDAILHDLQSDDFNFIGPLDFITGCKLAQETGWCEYAGLVSGVPAADAVTHDARSLVLIAAGDCSPSVWTGESDQLVPLLAQGCPAAPGTHVTPGKNGDVVAPGFYYGPFCHSDTTNKGSPRHASAIAAAGDAMVAWLQTIHP